MKIFIKTILTISLTCALNACEKPSSSTLKIGIIEPLEHTAMTEIVAGYSEKLKQMVKKPFVIDVENAQGDANMQRAIIQKMRDDNDALIVPIGTGATEMSLAMSRNQPVIGLASDIKDSDRAKLKNCHIAVVHDEISPQQLIAFIHAVYPHLTQLTLIHSTADKVLPEVKDAITAGKSDGITVNPIMVSSLPELYTAANAMPANTQGIFILKDSLIVSGVSTLAKIAAAKHIPLMTSDQGSVQNGAGFALGVHEREIGVQGAILSAAILNGKNPCELPIVEMRNLTVFINQQALQSEGQALAPLEAAAKQLTYKTEMVSNILN